MWQTEKNNKILNINSIYTAETGKIVYIMEYSIGEYSSLCEYRCCFSLQQWCYWLNISPDFSLSILAVVELKQYFALGSGTEENATISSLEK